MIPPMKPDSTPAAYVLFTAVNPLDKIHGKDTGCEKELLRENRSRC
jgi:hypothetical protein